MTKTEYIDISKLDPILVLIRLFKAARYSEAIGNKEEFAKEMTIEEAKMLLEKNQFVGFHRGRVISISFDGKRKIINPKSYDKANGFGLAAEVIAKIESEMLTA